MCSFLPSSSLFLPRGIQSVVQYGSKYRVVRVLTLDHTLRSLLVDESLPLSHIIRNVCAKIGRHL